LRDWVRLDDLKRSLPSSTRFLKGLKVQSLVGYQVRDGPECGLCLIVLGRLSQRTGTVHGAVHRYTDIISDQTAFKHGKLKSGFRNRIM